MYIKLNNMDFKKYLAYIDANPKWLEDFDNKDANGNLINYVDFIKTVRAVVG